MHGQRERIKSDLSIVSHTHGVKAETRIEIKTFFFFHIFIKALKNDGEVGICSLAVS